MNLLNDVFLFKCLHSQCMDQNAQFTRPDVT